MKTVKRDDSPRQGELFSVQKLPPGFVYRPDFIAPEEEAALLDWISRLPLKEARYRDFTARRRTVSYGGSYDFASKELQTAAPVPEFLHPLRQRVSEWTGVAAERFSHALVTEYATGTPLGWHRDVPEFEMIVGISLLAPCRMRVRPYPPAKGRNKESLAILLEPRSAYWMSGDARWRWQHSIPLAKSTRYSITFRTLVQRSRS